MRTAKERRCAFRRWVRTCPHPGEHESERQYAAYDQPTAALAYWARGVPVPEWTPGNDSLPGYTAALPAGDVDGSYKHPVGPGMGILRRGMPGDPNLAPSPIPGRVLRPTYPRGVDALLQQSVAAWTQANVAPPVRSSPITLVSAAGVAVTDGAWVTLAQVVAPDRRLVVINQFGFSCESEAADADVTWRARRNRIVFQNQTAVGPFGSLRDPLEVNWRFTELEAFDLQFISNTAGVTHWIRTIVKGWEVVPGYYDSSSIQPWTGR